MSTATAKEKVLSSNAIFRDLEAPPKREKSTVSPTEQVELLYTRDYHTCDCEMPYIHRKYGGAIGTFTEIRLCCMAKLMEKMTGQKLFEVFDFDPLFEWDCDYIQKIEHDDGTVEEIILGPPPKWMQERMAKKGIEIKNLGKHQSPKGGSNGRQA